MHIGAREVATADTHVLPTPEHIAELDRLGDEIADLSAHLDAATARLLDLIRVSGLLSQDRARKRRVASQSSSRPLMATRMIGFASRRSPLVKGNRVTGPALGTWREGCAARAGGSLGS
jgi:hypothetical protein